MGEGLQPGPRSQVNVLGPRALRPRARASAPITGRRRRRSSRCGKIAANFAASTSPSPVTSTVHLPHHRTGSRKATEYFLQTLTEHELILVRLWHNEVSDRLYARFGEMRSTTTSTSSTRTGGPATQVRQQGPRLRRHPRSSRLTLADPAPRRTLPYAGTNMTDADELRGTVSAGRRAGRSRRAAWWLPDTEALSQQERPLRTGRLRDARAATPTSRMGAYGARRHRAMGNPPEAPQAVNSAHNVTRLISPAAFHLLDHVGSWAAVTPPLLTTSR
jgi:hypothetical protein